MTSLIKVGSRFEQKTSNQSPFRFFTILVYKTMEKTKKKKKFERKSRKKIKIKPLMKPKPYANRKAQ